MRRRSEMKKVLLSAVLVFAGFALRDAGGQQSTSAAQPSLTQQRALMNQYCATCHNEKLKTADLMLDKLDLDHVAANAETWEKVVRKLRAGLMPPSGAPRPARAALDAFAGSIEAELDRAAATNINPGRALLHRMNRGEYAN